MKVFRRIDIDSLRAVSVISVIIFHLDQSFFPNGYLGVDIFFVISGYVITRSILKKYKEKKFKFLNFYFNRIKRIFPVLLVVLLTTFLLALFVLLTADLKRFLESLITSLGFVSNFYFWITGGYFSTNDQLKPLLHLWSLSVEEQFYLFFPFFIFLAFKLSKKINFYLFLTFTILFISFCLNLFFISKGHRDVIFFMFPARIWQFGLGVFFAFLPNLNIKNAWYDFFYLTLAILLIVFNFIYIIKYLPDATLMCMGVALILYKSINEKNYLSQIFQFRPLIFLGLISYSLYLWHWPIISLLKYIYIDGLTYQIILLSIFLIFSLSCLSWKFIEQPFLYNYSKKSILIFVVTSYLILLLSASAILQYKDFPSRYKKFPNLLANAIGSTYNCSISKYIKFGDTYACLINSQSKTPAKTVLFGNSHAYMYGWPFEEYLKDKNETGIVIQLSSCLPFIDKNISKKCLSKAKSYYNEIIENKDLKNVIIGFTWYSKRLTDNQGKKINDINFKFRKQSIDFLIENLNKHNKNVYLIGPIEIPKKQFSAEKISRELAFKKIDNYNFFIKKDNFDNNYNKIIEYYVKNLEFNFLQPHKILCDNENCFFADKEGSFFSDGNHLSKYGSLKMIPLFDKIK